MGSAQKKARFYYENFENYSIKIRWKYFEYVLINFYGFEELNKGGSTRLFIRGEVRFTADEPHGREDPFVFKDDRKRAIQAIRRLNLS